MRIQDVKILSLGLTDACNGRCLMCWHSNNTDHKICELEEHIYKQIKDSLFKEIKLLDLCGGGEAMLYSRISSVLEDIKKFNFKTKITTNFSSISAEQRELLKDMNVEFVISLDGSTKELQEMLRPGCDYDKIIDNIIFFKKHNKKLTFQTTVSDLNVSDMKNILRLAEKFGIDLVNFQELYYLHNLEEPCKLNRPHKDTKYLEYIINKKYMLRTYVIRIFCVFYRFWKILFPGKLCQNTTDMLKIQENGLVLSCCLPRSKVMGDLHVNSLDEIIGSKEFDNNRITCECELRRKKPIKPEFFSSYQKTAKLDNSKAAGMTK